MKFWVVAITGANVLILGPFLTQDHFWALWLKLHLLGILCCSMGKHYRSWAGADLDWSKRDEESRDNEHGCLSILGCETGQTHGVLCAKKGGSVQSRNTNHRAVLYDPNEGTNRATEQSTSYLRPRVQRPKALQYISAIAAMMEWGTS